MTSSEPHHSVPPNLQQTSPARQRRRRPHFNAAAYVSFDQGRGPLHGLAEVQFLAGSFGQLVETKGDMATVEKAAREALEGIEIGGDVHAPAEYRRHLGVVAAKHAVQIAYERAGAQNVPRSAFLV